MNFIINANKKPNQSVFSKIGESLIFILMISSIGLSLLNKTPMPLNNKRNINTHTFTNTVVLSSTITEYITTSLTIGSTVLTVFTTTTTETFNTLSTTTSTLLTTVTVPSTVTSTLVCTFTQTQLLEPVSKMRVSEKTVVTVVTLSIVFFVSAVISFYFALR